MVATRCVVSHHAVDVGRGQIHGAFEDRIERATQVLFRSHQLDQVGGIHAGAEPDLVVIVNVFPEGAGAGYDDRLLARSETTDDGAGSTVADDDVRLGDPPRHSILYDVSIASGLPGRPGGTVLDEAVEIARWTLGHEWSIHSTSRSNG